MDVASYRSQDTKAWPGKISLVVVVGSGRHSVREVEAELQKAFTTDAVVFEGPVESQSDLPIIAKKMKLRGKLVRVNTNGSNPAQLKALVERKVADYVSLEASGVMATPGIRLLDASGIEHEVVLRCGGMMDSEVRELASKVRGTLILYADKDFGALQALAHGITGPKSVRVRNPSGEQPAL